MRLVELEVEPIGLIVSSCFNALLACFIFMKFGALCEVQVPAFADY